MKRSILSLIMCAVVAVSAVFVTGCSRDNIPKYTATFVSDAGVSSVLAYNSQDYTATPTAVTFAYARSSETGEIDTTGEGQVNFKVVLNTGYVIDTITVTETDNYKNIKTSLDTGVDNTYRITKITGDITVNITTKATSEITAYSVSFSCDANCSVLVAYDTQSLSYSRDGDSGAILSTTDGQVNFLVVVADGYEIDEVVVTTGSYKNLKTAADDEDFEPTQYRVTKIKSNLTITITTKVAGE